ncbi:MAG: glutamate decarboxylase [Actinomycetota bacterium]
MSKRNEFEVNPIFARSGEVRRRHKYKLSEAPMLPETAYQVVHDDAMLDGNARLNLATFVTTWMDPMAMKLYADVFDKNMIDKDEYPATAEIEERCWRIIADLWHAPDPAKAIGTSTTGSSEAAMLGGLALKRRWQQARKAAGEPVDKPNLVMSSAVQVCWEKFANYFDIEPRYVPISADHPTLDGDVIGDYIDENTIGVVAIMGVTYTGMYEPVQQIAAALDTIEQERGLDIPIHVDAASGGMIAPFLQPEIDWDFRIERVHSINTSGHKYGLVYPGVGWVVWADRSLLPEDLVFEVTYLGGEMPTFALNFSRPGAQVLLQYYAFLRLGHEGYREVQAATRNVAEYLALAIGQMEPFTLWNHGSDIPVFAYRMTEGHTENWDLYDLSNKLREDGWLVPTYPMPDDMSDVVVQRIVVRNGMSLDLADKLLDSLRTAVTFLDGLDSPLPRSGRTTTTFNH